jgi:RNA polymerase sigma-70 factor (ECF subfamily)
VIPAEQNARFASWMREHASIGVRVSRAFEFNLEACADLLQEILLQWWRSIPNFPEASDPKRWLYCVSLNTAMNWQRRESKRGQVIDAAAPFARLIETVAQPADPIDRDAVDELYGAIQQLRPAERALIILHLDGLSYQEIAGTLGISVNAVGSRLTRIRDILAIKLKGGQRQHELV